MRIDLDKLDSKIKQLQEIKRLAADPEALSLLESLVVDGLNGTSDRKPALGPEQRKLTNTIPERAPRKGTLTQGVKEAIPRMSSRFTLYELTDKMIAEGFAFTAATPSIAVSDVLRTMLKKDNSVIRVYRRGKGATPTMYERTANQEALKLGN